MIKTVDNCPICKPIKSVIEFLIKNDFEIIEKKVSDYHFHELYFKLKDKEIEMPIIESITKRSKSKFTCECHWSTVETEATPTVV